MSKTFNTKSWREHLFVNYANYYEIIIILSISICSHKLGTIGQLNVTELKFFVVSWLIIRVTINKMLSATKNLFEKTIGFVAYISGPKERPTLSNPVLESLILWLVSGLAPTSPFFM